MMNSFVLMDLEDVLRVILRVILRNVLRGVLRGVIYNELGTVTKRFVVSVNDSLLKCFAVHFLAICFQGSLRMFMGPNIVDHECSTMRLNIVGHECITGGITPLDRSRLIRRFTRDRFFIIRRVNCRVSIHDGVEITLILCTVKMDVVIFFIGGVNPNDDSIVAVLKGGHNRRSTATISCGVETKVMNGRSARNHSALSVWYDGALTDHWVWLSNVGNDCFVIREIKSTIVT